MRAVLALGGVPPADIDDGVQQVRLRLLERAEDGREALRDPGAWAAVAASNLAVDWHRSRRRQERLGGRLIALGGVAKVPPCPRPLARAPPSLRPGVPPAALSESSRYVQYEDDPPPCDRTHQMPPAPPFGRTELLSQHPLAARDGRPDGGGDVHVLTLAVADGLRDLPAAQRQVLTLRFYADLSVGQIAGALGIPEGTVKSRLHAAVRTMRGRLRANEVM